MPKVTIGQQGTLKSIPKKVFAVFDDNYRIVYKSLGSSGRLIPATWSSFHAVAGGADTVVASGVAFGGLALASYASFAVCVVSGTQDGYVYIEKDVANNVITIKSTGSNTIGVDLTWFLGENPATFLLS